MSTGSRRALQLRLLWRIQRGICWRCKKPVGLPQASTDHVIPRSRGGSDQPNNLRMACKPCNNGAGSKLPTEPPPPIPMAGLKPYVPTKSYDRNTIAVVYKRYGDLCWLCGNPVPLHEAVRARVRMGRGYAHALDNVRLAHADCQDRRNRSHSVWASRLARSRRLGPRQRLPRQRHIVVLRRRRALVRPT